MYQDGFMAVSNTFHLNRKYRRLSSDAKLLYSYLRNLITLSMKNGWKDRNGIFVRMMRLKMADYLNRSLPTIRKVLRQLIDVGLLRERRMGQGKANRLYVQPFEGEPPFSTIENSPCPPEKKAGFTPERNTSATNNTNPNKPIKKSYYTAREQAYFRKYGRYEGETWVENGQKWIHKSGYSNICYEDADLNHLIRDI